MGASVADFLGIIILVSLGFNGQPRLEESVARQGPKLSLAQRQWQ